jgi:hypothetical protein
MDPKLVVLVVLIGAILGLSYLGSASPINSGRDFISQRRRKLVGKWRKT